MTARRNLVALLTVVLLAAPLSRARAQAPYELERSEEFAWVGAGLALTVAAGISSHMAKPPGPEAAEPDASDINSFDRRFMRPYREDHVGDALLATSFTLPFTLLGRDDVRDQGDELAMMWVEAALLNEGLVVLTKTLALRARPYVYDPAAPAALRDTKNSRFSFYSGHSAFSAMNCMFTATVFSDFSTDRNAEIAVWSGAVIYSAATAFRRVYTGHHFASDVITGLVVGSAVGCLVPILHRGDAPNDGVMPAASASRTFRIGASISF